MRTEQTTLNIGRIKTFKEVMQEMGLTSEKKEEPVLTNWEELKAVYEDLYRVILKQSQDFDLLNSDDAFKLNEHHRSR